MPVAVGTVVEEGTAALLSWLLFAFRASSRAVKTLGAFDAAARYIPVE